MSRPRVVITKHRGLLVLYDGDEEAWRCAVATGANPRDKEREGDRATPEGEFYICYINPQSRYHRFLGISYPNIEDAERGLRSGLIDRVQYDRIVAAIQNRQCPPWNTPLGGEIGLHGPSPNGTATMGCIAMAPEHIERLYRLLTLGDEVVILP